MSDSHVLQENCPTVSAVSPVQHVFLPCHFSSRDASLPYRLPNRSIPSLISQTLVLTCSVYPALGSLEIMNPPIPLPTIYHTKERTCLEASKHNSLAHHALTYALAPKPTHHRFWNFIDSSAYLDTHPAAQTSSSFAFPPHLIRQPDSHTLPQTIATRPPRRQLVKVVGIIVRVI